MMRVRLLSRAEGAQAISSFDKIGSIAIWALS